MPRVWHQPSLGKVNTWMFLHLEHGRCSRNSSYLFFSIVTVATPCWGFGTQHDLIFSCFWYLAFSYYSSDPSFLLFKVEFTLLSRAPNSLGSDRSAVSSLSLFMDTRIFLGNFFMFLVLLALSSRLILFLDMQGMQLNLIIQTWFLICA